MYNKKYLKVEKNSLQKIDSVYRKDENFYAKVFLEKFIHNCFLERSLTLKRLGEGVKPWFFVTFNIILKHIFPENFIEFPQVVQKI